MERLKQRLKVTAAFMAIMFLMTLGTTFLPEVTAFPDPVKIDSITPNEGRVGETVRVVGEIDTQNGTYEIIFDEEVVANGTIIDSLVDCTFVVPHRPAGAYDVVLRDVNATTSASTSFTIETAHYIKAVLPSPPGQLQEGQPTEIWVNVTGGSENTRYWANITVTDPLNTVFYNDTLQLTNTTDTGDGWGSRIYPTDFYPTDFGSAANTNYTGTYNIAFKKTDGTALATSSFTIGLTNATEYHRLQVVNIQAANYTKPDEWAWVNIAHVKTGETVFSNNTSAVGGIINASWAIPANASHGTYNVTVTNSTSPGTIKPIPDTQNFTIVHVSLSCRILAKNLNEEPLGGIAVNAYTFINATKETVDSKRTDKIGWANFSLDAGEYGFEAMWGKSAEEYIRVGSLASLRVAENDTLGNITCQLAHIKISVEDEANRALPFINLNLTYTYTTIANTTFSDAETFETNSTGTWKIYNMPTNSNYKIEAQRYGYLFNTTSLEKLPSQPWINITITCPTYTMFVHVLDSKGLPLQKTDVNVIEWSSGVLVGSDTTNNLGSVTFGCTFGRYKVRVYNYSALLETTVVLNETVIDLIEDQFFLLIYCKIYNIDLSLSVIDYYEQPIANAEIKVERDGVELQSLMTGKDGKVSRQGIIGGNYRFSIYVLGKLSEIRTLYIDRDKEIVFKIDRYIVIGGYPLEIVQFIALVSLSILVAIFALALIYRRISITRVKKKEEESTAQKE